MNAANAFAAYGDAKGFEPRPRIPASVIERIRKRYDITAVAGQLRYVFRKSGHEFIGLCPFHRERTPSWTLNDAKGFAHCFGCGAHHGTIDLVMDTLGLDFIEALRWLDESELPPVDPVVRQQQEEATRAETLRKQVDARRFFAEAAPVQSGDPVSVYLRARGILSLPPLSVRFGLVPKWQDRDSLEWGPVHPCMVCGAQDDEGTLTGIQRVFFRNNDPALGKADKPKRSLGPVHGSTLWLGAPAAHINLAEGPEDGLSAREMMPDRPCFVAFGTANMPAARFPAIVREVTLLGQNNDAGRAALRKSGLEMAGRLLTREAFPPEGYDDWNDLQRGIKK